MDNGRTLANAAPLGLAAFGITAFLASSGDANLWHQAVIPNAAKPKGAAFASVRPLSISVSPKCVSCSHQR